MINKRQCVSQEKTRSVKQTREQIEEVTTMGLVRSWVHSGQDILQGDVTVRSESSKHRWEWGSDPPDCTAPGFYQRVMWPRAVALNNTAEGSELHTSHWIKVKKRSLFCRCLRYYSERESNRRAVTQPSFLPTPPPSCNFCSTASCSPQQRHVGQVWGLLLKPRREVAVSTLNV